MNKNEQHFLEHSAQEICRIGIIGLREYMAGFALFDDVPVFHDEDTSGDGADKRQVV